MRQSNDIMTLGVIQMSKSPFSWLAIQSSLPCSTNKSQVMDMRAPHKRGLSY